MRRTILIALAMATPILARAQTPAKIDILKAMNEIPAPPASVQDAYSKSTCTSQNCKSDALFSAFESDWQSAQNQWKVLNQAQVRQMDSAKQLANSMKSSVGQSTTQQLEAAKQNIPGVNPNVMSFAEQMQDPAFKQKFMAMTPEQKMAYMQSGGVVATPSNPAIDSDAGITKTKQDFQQKMMSDPALHEAAICEQRNRLERSSRAFARECRCPPRYYRSGNRQFSEQHR
jgi:hypothetical protein